MYTRGDIKTFIKRRLKLISTSTVLTDDDLNDEIWNAYLWVASTHAWPQLEKAFRTVTEANQYYYDYPTEMQSDSAYKIMVNDESYDPTDYEDWLKAKENDEFESDDKKFATHARQYFIYPTPTQDDLYIDVWGLVEPSILSSDTDETVFSRSESILNRAIANIAIASIIADEKPNEARAEVEKASVIMSGVWTRIANRRQRFQKLDNPLFDVPDFFSSNGGASTSPTANFSVRNF